MDFSWLAQGGTPVRLPDPVKDYQSMMTLADLARRNRVNEETDAAQRDAQAIFGRAQEVGFEQAIKEGVAAGKMQGAQMVLKSWKEQQAIENDAKMKAAQAAKYEADAAKDKVSTQNLQLEPHVNRAAFLSRNPNASLEQIQQLVRDLPPSAMPTDVDFGDMAAAKPWLDKFAATNYKAHEQQQDLMTGARDAATAANNAEIRKQTAARDAAHASYQSRMATVAEGREGRIRNQALAASASMNPNDPAYQEMVDFWAEAAVNGDQQWRQGLGRTARGSQMILDVDKRIPQLVKERGMGVGDVMRARADIKASGKALGQIETDLAAFRPYASMLDRNITAVDQLAQQVVKTGIPVLNKPLNWIMQNLAGDPNMAEYLAQVRFTQTEAARVINNPRLVGVLTNEARAELEEIYNGNMTLEQTRSVLKRIKMDSENRVIEMERERDRQRAQISGAGHGNLSANAAPANSTNGQANGPSGTREATASPNTGNNRPAANQSRPKPPMLGEVRDGYRFVGGNPADPKNWEPVR